MTCINPIPSGFNRVIEAAHRFISRPAEEAIWITETHLREAAFAISAIRTSIHKVRRASGIDLAVLRKDWNLYDLEPPPIYPKGIPIQDSLVRNALRLCPPLRGDEREARLDATAFISGNAPEAAENLRAAHFKIYFAQAAIVQKPNAETAIGFSGLTDDDIRAATKNGDLEPSDDMIRWYRFYAINIAWREATEDTREHLDVMIASWWRTWARVFLRIYTSCDV